MTGKIPKRSVNFFSGANFFAVSEVKGKMMKLGYNKWDVKYINVETRQGVEILK